MTKNTRLQEWSWRFKRWRRFWPYWFLALAGSPFLFLLSRRRPLKQEKFLVMPQTNRLGDLVCATPVFRALKEHYPHAKLVVLLSSSKSAWEIIKADPNVDEIWFYEEPGLLGKLWRERFDWSFALTNYPLPSVLGLLGAIPKRVKTTVRPRAWSERFSDWLNSTALVYEHHTSLPRHYLRLLEPLGIQDDRVRPQVFETELSQTVAQKFYNGLKLDSTEVLIGISLSAGNRIKEWGDERFGELANRLVQRYKAKIIFFGSRGDQERIDKMLASSRVHQFSAATGFELAVLPSLIKRLAAYIAVDTGPIYVAYALGVPLVDIVGPVDPTEQPPIDQRSLLVIPPNHRPSSFVFHPPGSAEDHRSSLEKTSVDLVFSQVSTFFDHLGLPRR